VAKKQDAHFLCENQNPCYSLAARRIEPASCKTTGAEEKESPDLKGLLVARASMEELRRQIPIAIREMFEVNDTPVTVSEVESDDDCSWVAVPTELLVLDHAVAC
jgi:hypothetical protein